MKRNMLPLLQDRRDQRVLQDHRVHQDHRVLQDLKAHKDPLEPKDQKEKRVTGDPRGIQRQNHWVLQ